jgi:3-oxoacyl-[acyl-carrier-protein] synthase-3
MYSKIIGTGHYLPENVVTNYDLEKKIETNHDWIVERTGIHQRYIASEGETATSFGANAARSALENAGIDATDIDLIVVATSTPDKVYPSTATLIQAELGNQGSPAFDVTAACSGFIYALSVADNFIKAGSAKRALIIGTEVYSRLLDWNDRSTCVLFGDGAAAIILEASEEPGVLSTHIHSDGRHADLLRVDRPYVDDVDGNPYVQMKGSEVFKHAVSKLHEIVAETLTKNEISAEQVDWLIPHQANLRIINATAKKMGLDSSKIIITVDQHANTSAASIPLALDAARRDGRVKEGQLILLEAFGGGFTWGSALIRM